MHAAAMPSAAQLLKKLMGTFGPTELIEAFTIHIVVSTAIAGTNGHCMRFHQFIVGETATQIALDANISVKIIQNRGELLT